MFGFLGFMGILLVNIVFLIVFHQWVVKYANEFQKKLLLSDEGNKIVSKFCSWGGQSRLYILLRGVLWIFLIYILLFAMCSLWIKDNYPLSNCDGIETLIGSFCALVLVFIWIGCCLYEDIKNMQLVKLSENGFECPKCKSLVKWDYNKTFWSTPLECADCGKKITWLDMQEKLVKSDGRLITNSKKKANNGEGQDVKVGAGGGVLSFLWFAYLLILLGYWGSGRLFQDGSVVWGIAWCVCFLPAFFVKGAYDKEADMAREKYFNEHLVEFKKYNISEARAKDFIEDDKNGSFDVAGTFMGTALVLGIIIGLVYICNVEDVVSYKAEFWGDIAVFSWGFLSAIFAISTLTSDVEKKVFTHLEKYRCPFCSAPLSFWETKSYKSGEYHYQKKVKKYDSKLQMDVVKTENRVKYDEHHIYTCNYCKKTKDEVYPVDKCVDGFGV